MTALILLATLAFTYPSANAGPGCSEGPVPLTDLARAELRGLRIGELEPQTLKAWSVAPSMAGQPDTVSFDDAGASWLVWMEVLDARKNRSCQGNIISIGPPWVTGVGANPASARQAWFDISGRRLSQRPAQGVYFVRDSLGTRKVEVR